MFKTALSSLILLVFFLPQLSMAAQLLRHNPFKQPDVEAELPAVEIIEANEVATPELWYPQLRATMRAGNNSMANINGDIVRIGETVDGFKLIKVYEREALFIKNGEQYTIYMDQQYDEE